MDKINFHAAQTGSLILAPAQGRFQPGEAVGFLFSIVQLEDIVGTLSVSRVPFSYPHLDGLSIWRDLVLPVISFETLFKLAQGPISYDGNRAMVVKKRDTKGAADHWIRALIRIAPGYRLLKEVPQAEPVQPESFLPEVIMPAVKGMYRWEGGILIVPDIDRILSGEMDDVFFHHT